MTTSASIENIQRDLLAPFHPRHLEHRVGTSGKKKNGEPWVKIFTYVDNRAIMDRLDEVFSPSGWQSKLNVAPDGIVCELTCGFRTDFGTEWITKSDGSGKSDIEPFKGGISGSQKRAAVQFGIGRYLYDLEESWAFVYEYGKYSSNVNLGKKGAPEYQWISWSPPALPAFALPSPELAHEELVKSVGKLYREVDTTQRLTLRRQTGTVAELAQKFKPYLDKDYYLALEFSEALAQIKATTS